MGRKNEHSHPHPHHMGRLTHRSPTALPGVREWCPDVHCWRCTIRGHTYWIPDTNTVRHIFDLDAEDGREAQLELGI